MFYRGEIPLNKLSKLIRHIVEICSFQFNEEKDGRVTKAIVTDNYFIYGVLNNSTISGYLLMREKQKRDLI